MTHSPLRTFLDSGAPPNSTDYTTLVLIHGYGFHAPTFKKLLPLASSQNARIVLVNRRDYPGSAPFTDEERAALAAYAHAPPGDADAVRGTAEFMKARARELHDYLVELVEGGVTTPLRANSKTGGIVVAGWSLGGVWISALLSHVAAFGGGNVRLSEHVRRVVYYDPSYVCAGYQIPEGVYHAFQDPSLTPAQKAEKVPVWVSSYYAHGDVWTEGAAAVESRNALPSPPPTILTMTADDLAESTCNAPGEEGGSEQLLSQASIIHGTYSSLHEGAFHLQHATEVQGADEWPNVEVRYLWCDHSTWDMPLGAFRLSRELDEARSQGKRVRKVDFVRFRGANHFAHWDLPEKTLAAFLGNDHVIL